MAIKNNPLNQPISSLSASVFLMVQGTNGLTFNAEKNFTLIGVVELQFGNSEHLRKNFSSDAPWEEGIHCFSSKNEVFVSGDESETAWSLEFGQGRGFPTPLGNEYVRDANEWDTIMLSLFFLPKNVKIVSGEINLIINSTVKKTFLIHPQISQEIGSAQIQLKSVTVCTTGALK